MTWAWEPLTAPIQLNWTGCVHRPEHWPSNQPCHECVSTISSPALAEAKWHCWSLATLQELMQVNSRARRTQPLWWGGWVKRVELYEHDLSHACWTQDHRAVPSPLYLAMQTQPLSTDSFHSYVPLYFAPMAFTQSHTAVFGAICQFQRWNPTNTNQYEGFCVGKHGVLDPSFYASPPRVAEELYGGE